MGNVDPSTLRDFVIILVFVGGFVLQLLKHLRNERSDPPSATTEATLKTKVDALQAQMITKQDAQLCFKVHQDWEKALAEIKSRHSMHEDKISRQIGDLHTRLDKNGENTAAIGAMLKTFMEEIRSWRINHDARH